MLKAGHMSNFLYFVKEGEFLIRVKSGRLGVNVVKLGVGNCFGEEPLLLQKPNSYSVVTNSEHAQLYCFRKHVIAHMLNDEQIRAFKQLFM